MMGRGRFSALGVPRRGMALLIVLWMVLALSIMVVGVTRSVRTEAQMAGASRQMIVGGALGDAAIQLALQGLKERQSPQNALMILDVPYRGVQIAVEVMPLNGLVDINSAPTGLITAVFSIAGGVSPPEAEMLAQAVEEWRKVRDQRGRARNFEALEDLLQVPGVGYDLYANIVPLLTADRPGGGKVNPMAAPEAVLAVLAGGDFGVARQIASRRAAGDAGIDTTMLPGAWTDNSSTQRYRLRARVMLDGGGAVIVARSVDLAPSAKTGIFWNTFRYEQRLEAGVVAH